MSEFSLYGVLGLLRAHLVSLGNVQASFEHVARRMAGAAH